MVDMGVVIGEDVTVSEGDVGWESEGRTVDVGLVASNNVRTAGTVGK